MKLKLVSDDLHEVMFTFAFVCRSIIDSRFKSSYLAMILQDGDERDEVAVDQMVISFDTLITGF